MPANSPFHHRSLAGTKEMKMAIIPRATRKKRLTWRDVSVKGAPGPRRSSGVVVHGTSPPSRLKVADIVKGDFSKEMVKGIGGDCQRRA